MVKKVVSPAADTDAVMGLRADLMARRRLLVQIEWWTRDTGDFK